jgi:hypothetical protein
LPGEAFFPLRSPYLHSYLVNWPVVFESRYGSFSKATDAPR